MKSYQLFKIIKNTDSWKSLPPENVCQLSGQCYLLHVNEVRYQSLSYLCHIVWLERHLATDLEGTMNH
jgi:hypothetical protein